MNNNGNETVRETLERMMREKGYLKPENQITIKTPLGDFNYQSSLPQTAEQKPSDNADKGEFFIRDDVMSDIFDNGGYERRQKELENLVTRENPQKPLKYLNYVNG